LLKWQLKSHRKTRAQRGQTPILTDHFNWQRLSMAGALAYAPNGTDATLIFSRQPGSFNDESLITFPNELHDLLSGDKVTVIWDGLTSHRSKKMTTFLRSQRHWLVVERLPPYGHELSPVEQVWGNVKGRKLANLCPDSLGEAAYWADDGLSRVSGDAPLCRVFLRHCGLPLRPEFQCIVERSLIQFGLRKWRVQCICAISNQVEGANFT
jgi:hypothetical protein